MFEYTRRVEFRDTDTAGIVHFSVYFTYMEEAEHALLRSLGTSVHQETSEGVLSWPRVAAECDFSGAARFEDEVVVRVSVQRIGQTSVTYGFQCLRDGMKIASGRMTSVHCLIRQGEAPLKQRIPDHLRQQLEKHRESTETPS